MSTLIPRHVIGELDLTAYPFAIIQGASDYGSPQNVAEVIDSMLQDGEIVSSTRSSNRVMSFSVFIEESDMELLAQAEADLIAECDKQRNTWSIDPGDGVGAVTVFDIFRVQATYVHDDDWEWVGYRRYDLTFPALPFGRAANLTTIPALTSSASPTTVVMSDGTSATGWTSPHGSVTVSSGVLILPTGSATSSWTDSFGNVHQLRPLDVTYTFTAVDFTATPYLSLDLGVTAPDWQYLPSQPQVFVDGIEVAAAGRMATSTTGAYRFVFIAADPSATTIRIVGQLHTVSGSATTMKLDNMSRANVAPSASTTGRETLRTVTVEGSARTQASLKVSHASTALGRTVVYTCPALEASGYSPPLRPYRSTSGGDTTDTSLVSGTRTDPGVSQPQFQVPAAQLPKGGYLLFLLARSKSGTISATFSWTAETQVGSTLLGQQSGSSAPTSLTSGAWSLVPVGGMVLPPTDVSGTSSATVKISISGGVSYEWDEAFLFYMGDDAALTVVDAGTGTLALGSSHNTLWIESPNLDYPAPRVLLGVNGSSETGFHAGEKAAAWGGHQFAPGEMSIFVATTGAANPEVSLQYFRRFHSHATRAS